MPVVYTSHHNCDHILHLGCYVVTLLTYIWVIPYLVLIGYEQTAYMVNEGDTLTVCANVMSGIPFGDVVVTVDVFPGSASEPSGKLVYECIEQRSSVYMYNKNRHFVWASHTI